METHFVQVICNVDCKWGDESPKYRLFVNEELFTERSWIWRNEYLEELIQINAPPGKYKIRYELVDPAVGDLIVKNMRVIAGPGRIVKKDWLEIHNEIS